MSSCKNCILGKYLKFSFKKNLLNFRPRNSIPAFILKSRYFQIMLKVNFYESYPPALKKKNCVSNRSRTGTTILIVTHLNRLHIFRLTLILLTRGELYYVREKKIKFHNFLSPLPLFFFFAGRSPVIKILIFGKGEK